MQTKAKRRAKPKSRKKREAERLRDRIIAHLIEKAPTNFLRKYARLARALPILDEFTLIQDAVAHLQMEAAFKTRLGAPRNSSRTNACRRTSMRMSGMFRRALDGDIKAMKAMVRVVRDAHGPRGLLIGK